jgi:hypothetical protein
VNWEEPVLRIREYEGNFENNLVGEGCGEQVVAVQKPH